MTPEIPLGSHLYCPVNEESKSDLTNLFPLNPPEWSKVNVDRKFLQTIDNVPFQVFIISSLADSSNPVLATPFASLRLLVIRPTPNSPTSIPLTLPVNEPTAASNLHDLTSLPHLHAPSLISSLSYRFDNQLIYTVAGTGITISINPCKPLPSLYSPSQITHYHALSTQADQTDYTLAAPHVYKVAAAAAQSLQTSTRDQAILVSGESGAGKTVATRYVLKYLSQVTATKPSTSTATIQDRVTSSNPILESFGNAQTLRNPNSSRFGKFITLTFQIGATRLKMEHGVINTYLLEKSRILDQQVRLHSFFPLCSHMCVAHTCVLMYIQPGERNYHIFYQLLKNRNDYPALFLPAATYSSFCSSFAILKDAAIPPPSEHTDLSLTLAAFETMGFTPEQIDGVLHAVSACLHLGNLDFLVNAATEAISIPETPLAAHVCELLGVPLPFLVKALTTRTITTGSDSIVKHLSLDQCQKAKDALVKALYESLFTDLVAQINLDINSTVADATQLSSTRGNISLLDIFGFETFETNSLEQLCINYCNEILQSQFNRFVFSNEQRLYTKEGIQWDNIDWSDNKAALDVVAGPDGVLRVLDDQCKQNKTDDRAFANRVYEKTEKAHPKAFHVTNKNKSNGEFNINHYAGSVTYNCVDFLEKNKDELPRESAELLKASSVQVISSLAGHLKVEESGKKTKIASDSTTKQFKEQLGALVKRIDATQPHYIRCIKPNNKLAPDLFHDAMVGDQLRCAGVLEAVRVSRLGFPHRFDHEEFVGRYGIVVEGEAGKKSGAKEKCLFVVRGVLAKGCVNKVKVLKEKEKEVSGDEDEMKIGELSALYGMQVGKSKVFLQRSCYEELELARVEKLHVFAIEVQRVARSFLARLKVQGSARVEERRLARLEEAEKARAAEAEKERKREEEVAGLREEREALEEKARALQCEAAATLKVEHERAAKELEEKAKEMQGEAAAALKVEREKAARELEAKLAAEQTRAATELEEKTREMQGEAATALKAEHEKAERELEEKAVELHGRARRRSVELQGEAAAALQAEQERAAKELEEKIAAEQSSHSASKLALETEHDKAMKIIKDATEKMRVKLEKENTSVQQQSKKQINDTNEKLQKKIREEREIAKKLEAEKEQAQQLSAALKAAKDQNERTRITLESEKRVALEKEQEKARKVTEEISEAMRVLELGQIEAIAAIRLELEEARRAKRAVEDEVVAIKHKIEEDTLARRISELENEAKTKSLMDEATREIERLTARVEEEEAKNRALSENAVEEEKAKMTMREAAEVVRLQQQSAAKEKEEKMNLLEKYFGTLTPLHAAVAANDEKAVEMMLSHQAPVELLQKLRSAIDVNGAGGRDGKTALHLSMLNENVSLTKLLIEKGADVGKKDMEGNTALHLAEDVAMMEALIEGGGGVKAANKLGFTPLHLAVSRKDVDGVNMLVAAGAELNAGCEGNGRTAMHLAARDGEGEMVAVLAEVGKWVNMNAKDRDGNTPLHLLAGGAGVGGGSVAAMRMLLEGGADVNRQNLLGESALVVLCQNIAARQKNLGLEMMKVLLRAGARADLKANDGSTALHFVVYCRGGETMEMGMELMEAGASLTGGWKFPKKWARWWAGADEGRDVVLVIEMLDEAMKGTFMGSIRGVQGWVGDNFSNQCMECDAGFGLLQRRHHCRCCGRCICGECVGEAVARELLPADIRAAVKKDEGGRKVRVCVGCEDVLVRRGGGSKGVAGGRKDRAGSDLTFDTFVGSEAGAVAGLGQ